MRRLALNDHGLQELTDFCFQLAHPMPVAFSLTGASGDDVQRRINAKSGQNRLNAFTKHEHRVEY